MKTTSHQKGSVVALLLVIIVILIAGFGYYVYHSKQVQVASDGNGTLYTPPADTTNTPTQTPVQTPTQTPVVTPPTQPTSTTKTVTSTSYKFSLQAPKDFTVAENSDSGYFNETNVYSMTVSAPETYQKGTDVDIVRMAVLVSPTTSKCYTDEGNQTTLSSSRIINGITFYYNAQQPYDDDAMGGVRGKESLWAAIANGKCYRISKSIVYRDERGFVDPPYKPHFNEAKANADIDAIISTLVINTK